MNTLILLNSLIPKTSIGVISRQPLKAVILRQHQIHDRHFKTGPHHTSISSQTQIYTGILSQRHLLSDILSDYYLQGLTRGEAAESSCRTEVIRII